MPAILRVENLSKAIGDLELFNNVSFVINEGEKVALVARNGAGKSTLLNILAGNDSQTDGNTEWLPDVKIGYLLQDYNFAPDKTIADIVFEHENELMQSVKNYEIALESGDVKKIEKASTDMERLSAWDYETRIKSILSQLKIHNLQQKVSELSGGQKKRVALANALVSEPDFLVLDEPTNHLDINSIEWLEGHITKARITLFMVTHDRYFLDRVCDHIIEIDDVRKEAFRYEGNYTQFLVKREERIEQEQQQVSNAKNLLRTEEDWMSRMPKARGTKAKYRIEQVHELRKIAANTRNEEEVKIQTSGSRLGSKIIVTDHLNFSWNKEPYLKDFTYTFSRFEKIGILGENGSGKTTFLQLLTGILKADSGTLEHGETLKVGYYKQSGLAFNENMKVLDAVTNIAETIKLGDGKIITAAQFLNHFLFPNKRQHDHIYKLSGGEKRRLYLCTVLMRSPNFLILDEPTNDLDIVTLEVLEEYLASFNGCVMVVSHDRYFLDKVVDHIFVFKGNGIIKDFPGNYTQFFNKENQRKKEEAKIEQVQKKQDTPPPVEKSRNRNKLSFSEKRELEQLEKDMEQLNAEKEEIESALNSGSLSPEKLQEKSARIGKLMEELDEKEMRWLELSEKE